MCLARDSSPGKTISGTTLTSSTRSGNSAVRPELELSKLDCTTSYYHHTQTVLLWLQSHGGNEVTALCSAQKGKLKDNGVK